MSDKDLKPSDIARELCRKIQYHINEATLSDAQAEVILIEFWNTRPESPLVGLDEGTIEQIFRWGNSCEDMTVKDFREELKKCKDKYRVAKFGSPQKVHACKCRNDNDCARTVKRLDEDLFECPRCGGIIVPKPNPHFVEVGKIEWPKKLTHINQVPPMDSTMRACGYFDGWNNAIDACKAEVNNAVEKAKGRR